MKNISDRTNFVSGVNSVNSLGNVSATDRDNVATLDAQSLEATGGHIGLAH